MNNVYIKQCLNDSDTVPVIHQRAIITSGVGLIVTANVAHSIIEKYKNNQYVLDEKLHELFNFDWFRKNS